MPKVFGITGLMGSGKSYLANLFLQKGWHIIDVDLVGKNLLLLDQSKKDLVSFFGHKIIDSDGNIIPSVLGSIVFNNPQDLHQLNSYMHPKMKQMIKNEISLYSHHSIIIHAALLFQMNLQDLCNFIISLCVPIDLLKVRILERKTYLNDKTLSDLLEKQKKDNNFFASADIIIDNSLDKLELSKKFERLYTQFKEDIYE